MRLRARIAAGALGVVAVAALGLGALYASRNAVGVRLARDYLRARGVPARITVDRLDAGGAAGALSLGPPERPDLTVDRAEASFAPLPPLTQGVSAPKISAIRLIRPHLRARFDGRRFDLGSLQRLMDETARGGSSGGRGPDVTIQDGLLDLATPAGVVSLHVDATLIGGRLTDLRAGLDPSALAWRDMRAAGLGGLLIVREAGAGRLHADLRLGAAGLEQGAGATVMQGRGVQIIAQADAPQTFDDRTTPVAVDATVRAGAASAQGARSGPLSLDLRFAGVAGGPLEGLVIDGKAVAALAARKLSGLSGRVEADEATLNLSSARLRLTRSAAGMTLDAPLTAVAKAGRGRAGLGDAACGGGLRLAQAELTARGAVGYGPPGVRLRMTAAAQARGGLDRASAKALAARAVAPSLDAKANAALTRALSEVAVTAPALELSVAGRSGRLTMRRPLQAQGGGETLSVASTSVAALATWDEAGVRGAGRATLAGAGLPQLQAQVASYRIGRNASVEAAADVAAQGSLGPLRDADLRLSAIVRSRDRGLTVSTAHCAPWTFARFESRTAGSPLLRDVAAEVCPSEASPLLSLEGGPWRARAVLHGLVAGLPTAQASLRNGDLHVDLGGDSKGLQGRVAVERVAVADLLPAARFRPLMLSGAADLVGDRVRGDFAVATVAHARPLGRVTVTQDLKAGYGEAQVEAQGLTFVRDGLQPADIAPAAGLFASQAQGEVDVSAHFAWSAGGLRSSGRMRTARLDLRSPAGVVSGLAGDVELTSLVPLVTAPGQAITATRVEALLPLTDVAARAGLTASGFDMDALTAVVAHGRVSLDPLHVSFAPKAVTQGVLRLEAIDLGEVLGVLNLSNAVTAQARLSGALPFAIGPAGVRLIDGRLFATGPGRLTVRREALTGGVATAGAAGAQPNAVQDFAYQALENLAFDSLDATVASRDGGRLGMIFHIKGLHDPPKPLPTRLSLLALLRGTAFDKPIPLPKGTPVDLTLDTSINFDDLLNAYGAIGRGVEGSAPVHP